MRKKRKPLSKVEEERKGGKGPTNFFACKEERGGIKGWMKIVEWPKLFFVLVQCSSIIFRIRIKQL